MTEAEAAIADLDAALADVGEDVTLIRFSDDGLQTPLYEVPCRAAVRAHAPQQLLRMAGDAPDSQVILSPTSLSGRFPGHPRRDDRVMLDRGRRPTTIQEVAPISVAGTIVRFELQVRG
jgi:hypothetical protein